MTLCGLTGFERRFGEIYCFKSPGNEVTDVKHLLNLERKYVKNVRLPSDIVSYYVFLHFDNSL
jgi:hypothetical protein